MTTLTFGKYKGQDVKSIFDSDPSYCIWLLTQPKILSPTSDLYKVMQSRFEHDPNIYLSFGRHKGKTLKYVFDTDPKYCEWMLRSDFVSNRDPSLLTTLKTMSCN